MNKQEANGDQRLPGLAGGLQRKGGGPHAQDRSSQATTITITKAFWQCSRRTRKKLVIDPFRQEPAEALRERIRQTDELIDAVVYRLYGLNEDEIRIVEGTKSN